MPIEKGTGYRMEFPLNKPPKERHIIDGRGTQHYPALDINRVLIIEEYLRVRQNIDSGNISVRERLNTYINTDPVDDRELFIRSLFGE